MDFRLLLTLSFLDSYVNQSTIVHVSKDLSWLVIIALEFILLKCNLFRMLDYLASVNKVL